MYTYMSIYTHSKHISDIHVYTYTFKSFYGSETWYLYLGPLLEVSSGWNAGFSQYCSLTWNLEFSFKHTHFGQSNLHVAVWLRFLLCFLPAFADAAFSSLPRAFSQYDSALLLSLQISCCYLSCLWASFLSEAPPPPSPFWLTQSRLMETSKSLLLCTIT